jgi:hypothetical protein
MIAPTTCSSSERGRANLSAADLDHALGSGRGCLAQEAEHDACQQSLEAAQRFESSLAFGLPALEVRAGAWVPTALDHGQLVQRAVELAISVAVQAVALLLARGGIERRDAGEPRELRVGAKAADPGGLADELSGDQSATALQIEELGRIVSNAKRNFPLELVSVEGQRATAGDEIPRDPHLDALRCAGQPAFDTIKPDLAVQSPGRNAQFGLDGVQQPPQPVLGLGALPDERLAMVDEQLDLARLVVLDRDGQFRVAEGRPGDRERVDAVGLPKRPRAATRTGHQLRRNPNHVFAARDQRPLKAPADAAGILQRLQTIRAQAVGPTQHFLVTRSPRGASEFVDDLAGLRPNRHRGVRLLVRVHSDNNGHSSSLFDDQRGWSSSGQASIRAKAKLLSGHAGDPRAATGDSTERRSGPQRGDSGTKSQPTADPRT